MIKTEKELDEMVEEMFESEDWINEFAMQCYNGLSEDKKQIYDKSTKLFTKQQCTGDILSVLIMDYPENGFKTKEAIYNEHSKLYEPFEITESLEWVVNEVLNLYNHKNSKLN